MKAIYDFLSLRRSMYTVAYLAPELIEQFVGSGHPIADYSYRWKLNTGCKNPKRAHRSDGCIGKAHPSPSPSFLKPPSVAQEANKMPHQFRRARGPI